MLVCTSSLGVSSLLSHAHCIETSLTGHTHVARLLDSSVEEHVLKVLSGTENSVQGHSVSRDTKCSGITFHEA